jgi:hypothetical protein
MVLYAHRTRAMRAAEDNRSLRARFRAMFATSF